MLIYFEITEKINVKQIQIIKNKIT